MGKKGLSTIVTNIIIILFILIAIGIIWGVVSGFLKKGSSQFSLSKYTIDIQIEHAELNFSSGIGVVRVFRDAGEGNLVGIKFIFEDSNRAETFDVDIVNFLELEERTFNINVQTGELILIDINKVSIAPVIQLESGEIVIGKISSSFGGLNNVFVGGGSGGSSLLCNDSSDCGTDYLIGDPICLNGDLYQYKIVYFCNLLVGICSNPNVVELLLQDCPSFCYDGECVPSLISCTNETVEGDCGLDEGIGDPFCSENNLSVFQNFKNYECIGGFCNLTISPQLMDTCVGEEVCFNGECFIPIDCSNHGDCDPGEICESGNCVTEFAINAGEVFSIWPFGIGEYFDSPDLEDPSEESYVGQYVHFITGSHIGFCMEVTEHHRPNPTASPYIRLNETQTNISAGDLYEIWETMYNCG